MAEKKMLTNPDTVEILERESTYPRPRLVSRNSRGTLTVQFLFRKSFAHSPVLNDDPIDAVYDRLQHYIQLIGNYLIANGSVKAAFSQEFLSVLYACDCFTQHRVQIPSTIFEEFAHTDAVPSADENVALEYETALVHGQRADGHSSRQASAGFADPRRREEDVRAKQRKKSGKEEADEREEMEEKQAVAEEEQEQE